MPRPLRHCLAYEKGKGWSRRHLKSKFSLSPFRVYCMFVQQLSGCKAIPAAAWPATRTRAVMLCSSRLGVRTGKERREQSSKPNGVHASLRSPSRAAIWCSRGGWPPGNGGTEGEEVLTVKCCGAAQQGPVGLGGGGGGVPTRQNRKNVFEAVEDVLTLKGGDAAQLGAIRLGGWLHQGGQQARHQGGGGGGPLVRHHRVQHRLQAVRVLLRPTAYS